MKLKPDQVKLFWRLWPQACRANGWTKENGLNAAAIDARRREVLADCGFTSLTLVGPTDGFTKVKNHLLVLIGTSVKAGMEVGDPTLNKARVLRHVVLNELIPCLALYVEDFQSYLTSIMADKNRWWKIDRPARDITLEDLDAKPIFRWVKGQSEPKEFPSKLEQLMMTINARIHAKRKEFGETVHDMKMRAKVKCDCSLCCKRRRMATVPVGTDDEAVTVGILSDENPF